MSNDFRSQMYNFLNQKDTEELAQIWQENDRVEWTEMAFDTIRVILLERIGELPPQNEPVLVHVQQKDEPDNQESIAEILSNAESQPVLYQPEKVLWLEKWLNRAALFAIVITVGMSLLQSQTIQRTIWSFFLMNPTTEVVSWVIALPMVLLAAALECALIYFPLKALAFILRVLMQMEFNSRGAGLSSGSKAPY